MRKDNEKRKKDITLQYEIRSKAPHSKIQAINDSSGRQ